MNRNILSSENAKLKEQCATLSERYDRIKDQFEAMAKVTKRERSPSPPSLEAGKRRKQENISDVSERKQETSNTDFFEDKEGKANEATTSNALSDNWENVGSSQSVSSYAAAVNKDKTAAKAGIASVRAEDIASQEKSKDHDRFGSPMAAYTCVTNASFLTEKDCTEYDLWPKVTVEAIVPHCLVNRQNRLSLSLCAARNQWL